MARSRTQPPARYAAKPASCSRPSTSSTLGGTVAADAAFNRPESSRTVPTRIEDYSTAASYDLATLGYTAPRTVVYCGAGQRPGSASRDTRGGSEVAGDHRSPQRDQ